MTDLRASDGQEGAELRDLIEASIARRVAKRAWGEGYDGYETTHGEAGEDFARAALAAIAAAQWQLMPPAPTQEMIDDGVALLALGDAGPEMVVRRLYFSALAKAPRP